MNNILPNFPITAPRFDLMKQRAAAQPIVTKSNEIAILTNIRKKIKSIAVSGGDEYRHFWFYLDRGKIRDYGSFAEFRKCEVVETREQFKEMWLYDYPEQKHWYHLEANEYDGDYYLYLDRKLIFQTSSKKQDYYAEIDNSEFLNLLSDIVDCYCQWIVNENVAYNSFINLNLSYCRRLGKIVRQKYWKINPYNKKMITKGIKVEDKSILKKIAEQSDLSPMKTMTSGKFFEYCRLGYDANGYFKKKPDISNLDAYSAFADGRDEGLRELDPNSESDFRQWFFDESRYGGHPWEVCRGGNSTHISLYVHHKEDGWTLRLAGSSSTRVNETVKFALALYKNKIPFELQDASEIFSMVTGTDYIGIVPKEIFPRYCHSLFSDDKGGKRIIDFMNLGNEDAESIVVAAEWYPVEIFAEKQS
ncbi:MAG: hypothetical protein LBQ31_11110 [Bacteroidales bacterium]|jgi:hypothetical protein|nr:hypothetical protein [Bacteroidales bacterium]